MYFLNMYLHILHIYIEQYFAYKNTFLRDVYNEMNNYLFRSHRPACNLIQGYTRYSVIE